MLERRVVIGCLSSIEAGLRFLGPGELDNVAMWNDLDVDRKGSGKCQEVNAEWVEMWGTEGRRAVTCNFDC